MIILIIPIRCFTCGKEIATEYKKYKQLLEEGKTPKEALDYLGLTRYCCRKMILTHVETIDDVIKYKV